MSQENVEIVRKMQDAFLSSAPDRALAFFAADVEWDVSDRPGGSVWHGPSGVRQAMAEWSDAWVDWEVETEGYLEAGAEDVLLLWREHARGRGSGAGSEQRGAILVTIRDSLIVRGQLYTDQRAALKAVGLEE